MPDESNEQSMAGVRGLVTGGVLLLSVGGVISLAGGLAVAAAAFKATRGWVQTWEAPPKVVAQRRWAQARSAAMAGAQGWRQNGNQTVEAPR